ncbi:uncharacterized protein LOC131226529 [Magnolia sinica]|uniref:uncharacterized protein LOC131226529 n=1 Tax=Magnolia sinica TaxID=86752 RepID=UPI0026580FB8|nr:uncharacterized protein LOC131226529 [Magnolia sinica]
MGQTKYVIVAVDYFTKWAEAEPIAKITEQRIKDFVWKNVIYWFSILHTIVFDNEKQFDNDRFRGMCQRLDIVNAYSSPRHLHSNGQVEVVNKIIKNHLKTKLEKAKGNWAEELPFVLWGIQNHSSINYSRDLVLPLIRLIGRCPGRDRTPHYSGTDLSRILEY